MNDLKSQVELAIDGAVCFFDAADRNSYERWDSELCRLAQLVETSALPERDLLFGDLLSWRTSLAFDTGEIDLVLALGAEFLAKLTPNHPRTWLVVTLYTRALHATGLHSEEIALALETARQPAIRGEEFVSLLNGLYQKHPGLAVADSPLVTRFVEEAVALQQVYSGLSMPSGRPEQFEADLQKLIAEMRRISSAVSDAVLRGESPHGPETTGKA